jgi:predicted dehydrogenase
MLRVGVVGFGYWGPNLARNFHAHPGFHLARVADTDADRRARAQDLYPQVDVVADANVAADPDLDVIAVVTPVFTHFDIARQALLNGKHVWIEKPMTSTVEQAKELVDLAESRDLTLMVDSTFLFTGAVNTIKKLIGEGELGNLFYYDSVRANLGPYRHDVNAIWDLAPHDLSIMEHLLGPTARAVCAQGRAHFENGPEDVAYVSVLYDNNLIAHLHLNWLSPVKVRRTTLGGSKKMLLWDDLNADEAIKVYDTGMEFKALNGGDRVQATPRHGAMHAPIVQHVEALKTATDYFHHCIVTSERPINDGSSGLRVVRILEATDRSLLQDGRVIELEEAWVAK